MQRIMVDLPDPEGPQTTTFSFCPTVSVTSRRTCMAPYHLFTLSSTMAGIWLLSGASVVICMAALMAALLISGCGSGRSPAPARASSGPW